MIGFCMVEAIDIAWRGIQMDLNRKGICSVKHKLNTLPFYLVCYHICSLEVVCELT